LRLGKRVLTIKIFDMLPIIASSTAVLAISYSFAVTTFPKWMPNYQVSNFSLKKIDLYSFFRSGEISVTIKAGVLVENSLRVGTELHASHVDIYYPDWEGELQYIADLNIIDQKPIEKLEVIKNDSDDLFLVSNFTDIESRVNNKSVPISTSSSNSASYFTFPPKQSTYKHDNIVEVHNLGPKTYLNGLMDALGGRGKINVGSTAVLQIKTSNVPLTIELICDHAINLISFPIRIAKRNCALEGVAAGWGDFKSRGENLRLDTQKRFLKTGSIFRRGESKMDYKKSNLIPLHDLGLIL